MDKAVDILKQAEEWRVKLLTPDQLIAQLKTLLAQEGSEGENQDKKQHGGKGGRRGSEGGREGRVTEGGGREGGVTEGGREGGQVACTKIPSPSPPSFLSSPSLFPCFPFNHPTYLPTSLLPFPPSLPSYSAICPRTQASLHKGGGLVWKLSSSHLRDREVAPPKLRLPP